MAKEVVISTSSINSYGARVITSGIDIEQYQRNPVLLYMHQRALWGDKHDVIGRMENLRVDGDKLIGTPVFDTADEFAATIARKWDDGFLRMASAGLEPVELSSETDTLLPGQSRPTLTKSKLVEVSIVDVGSNDDALQLYSNGKLLTLAAGVDSQLLPLLPKAGDDSKNNDNTNQINLTMDKILLMLGLAPTATEADAVNAITALQNEAKKVETIELARITGAVEAAITANKTTADKRDHLISLGKTSGFEALQTTLELLNPAPKPMDIIGHGGSRGQASTLELTYSTATQEQLLELRENNKSEYARLYKAEFGFAPQFETK